MPEVKEHTPGMLSWANLSTTDEKGALKFYSGLFGWKDDPRPMGPGQTYHMQNLKGRSAAALMQQMEDEAAMKLPSHWTVFFTVKNVDEAAERAGKAGGKLLQPPMDVFDVGRMATIQDPQGAVFALWQPMRHKGAGIMNEPGAMTWGELLTTDAKAAAPFYEKPLGVKAMPQPGAMAYTILQAGGKDSVGVMNILPEMGPMPPNWMVYFEAADIDASVKKAQELGAKVMRPGTDIPTVGRFAVLQDPQGAFFCLFKRK